MIAHLLFEQSGTFKKAFKKNGIEAFDYDIQNEFEQTDFQIDLFEEIQKAYEGGAKRVRPIQSRGPCNSIFPVHKV